VCAKVIYVTRFGLLDIRQSTHAVSEPTRLKRFPWS